MRDVECGLKGDKRLVPNDIVASNTKTQKKRRSTLSAASSPEVCLRTVREGATEQDPRSPTNSRTQQTLERLYKAIIEGYDVPQIPSVGAQRFAILPCGDITRHAATVPCRP
ncbi:nonribosomal peptide synthase [Pseudozyma hubeiensis SY62]|uniref:Nonribosomal peptide synthase n=1 Tax=Pseudozyma hubeiensis (strain SY62) TaxID=1305764 RepID=R9NXT2_PSEHS|nr:nonribosomal peptide synthase [Pseudozyma hubeiensis SY62]GAC93411.1 nonribosomal peptide synthase [Pseudozyma hubeiensis SY62]